ncbi:MAG: VCBS repeat-containing protein, partial [Bacteroidia bacterium]|nr:VCBS repeat-containing protein [Bacteroidia bacterium]
FNTMQLGNGDGTFQEMGQIAGVSKTDWSWAPLFADFDGDGNKDLFVTNGIKREMTDNDYKNRLSERSAQGQMHIDEVFELVPSFKLANYMCRNKGNGTFENAIQKWGLSQKLNSNGAAYGDLDNDGDLDLVLNNLEDFCSVYQNNSSSNYLRIKFKGTTGNTQGIGCKLEVTAGGETQYYSHFLTRGFQSSNSPTMVIGLNDYKTAESIRVTWPDGKTQLIENVKANKQLLLDYADASAGSRAIASAKPLFKKKTDPPEGLRINHTENNYNDFEKEVLLPNKLSTIGPAFVKGDVNNDGLVDVFIGSAHGNTSSLYIQDQNGKFSKSNQSLFNKDRDSEDIDALFFDADNDKDMDLYVLTGSNEKEPGNRMMSDRLYINNGNGKFRKSNNRLPDIRSSGSVVRALDYDKDGYQDLFVAGRVIPGQYPLPADSYLLKNENNRFIAVNNEMAPGLNKLGLVTDAICSDYDGDGDEDIIVVGEWMGLIVMENENGRFIKNDLSQISGTGWWYAVHAEDLDQDGDLDLVLGNLGLNNKFGAKEEKPFHVFCDDFDNTGNLDIVLSKESSGKLLPVRGRECSSQQMPFIKDKFPTFKSFAEADLIKIYGEDKLSSAIHYQADNFESVILVNDGNQQYKRKSLPLEAQFGPTLDILVRDINKDGHLDIIGAGNIYNAEVETVRYDASKGYVLLGDGQNNFEIYQDSGLITSGNVKSIEIINCGDIDYLVTAVNDGNMEFFELLQ